MTDGAVAAPVVAVVGGGIAGLAAAWELIGQAPGSHVHVFEASARLGGKIATGTLGGQPVDVGPDAFVARRPEARALCAELGLEGDLVAPGRRGASVWARGRLRPLPAGLALGVPTRLWPLARSGICSPTGIMGAAADLLKGSARAQNRAGHVGVGDMSVGDIVDALGPEVVERLADPLIGGIHAGSVRTMSAAAVFPLLLEAYRRGGSLMRALRRATAVDESTAVAPVFLALTGGMERLVTRLAEELGNRGVAIRTGAAVTAVRRGDRGRFTLTLADGVAFEVDGVIMALPAPAAAGVLEEFDRELAGHLRTIAYASVALVSMRMAEHDVAVPSEGTGFLVPRTEGRFITACTWMSSKWPQLHVPGEALVRASAGRFGDPLFDDLSDDVVAARAVSDLTSMGVLHHAPLETVVARWPHSFPQYEVGHLDKVAAIEAVGGAHRGLALAGAALHGVGIPACIGSGRRAAATVLEHTGTSHRNAS